MSRSEGWASKAEILSQLVAMWFLRGTPWTEIRGKRIMDPPASWMEPESATTLLSDMAALKGV